MDLSTLFRHPPSPLEELHDPLLQERGVRLLVKRDDLLCFPEQPAFSGNKWRKLKYNLLAARADGHDQLLTFGGAYSNHIAAVAAAGLLFGFRTVGIIRGEAHTPLNPTLRQATEAGMQLHYLDRATYRQKNTPELLDHLDRKFGKSYCIPEGGSNAAALQGCAELAEEISDQLAGEWPDCISLSCGTGGTLAGLVAGLRGQSRVLGFPALKGDFLLTAITSLLKVHYPGQSFPNWSLQTDYHCGGYARFTPELIDFINGFGQRHGIALDPIYTGKLFFGLFDLIGQGAFPSGSTLLAVHTGGRQGVAGFNERLGGLIR